MTPRSFARTPSVTTEDVAETPASDFDSGDESLPPHTSEIGTLKKLPNHGTAWLGSSSGVYFVNTVRRAFSAALIDSNTATSIPASEDILTGEDADGQNYNGPVTDGPSATEGDFRRVILASLGRPPADRALAMDLVTSFFRSWHPLFPFMHGPRFLQDIDAIYSMSDTSVHANFTATESRRVVTFQLIINIASLDRADIHLPIESRIKSTSDVTRVAGCFSVNHDIATIQLLIAAELYLVATISLRQASTVAGMILKLIYHAGLHRCPLRYASLSLEDCEIRKRIFWSAYALDRHLSLSLGDPNTVQDNDIDVCLSGRELHKAVAHELILDPNDELKMHLPRPQAGPHGLGSPSDDPRVVDLTNGPQAREKAQREAAMTAYVHYGKLTGRIIEIFHKSIHARFQTPEAITFLNSDIETWWNDLPSTFTDTEHSDSTPPPPSNSNTQSTSTTKNPQSTTTPNAPQTTHKQLAPFFLILYHQLQLLLNRPRLSLDQSTAEFQHGLQICIKASRNTLSAFKKHRENAQSMLLPGLLSAAWMAGLIIAFACQLGKYPKLRACSDISSCLDVLESMRVSQWFTVKNCHKVLSLLLENIKARKAGANGFLSAGAAQRAEAFVPAGMTRKRTLDEGSGSGESPKRKSVAESSPGQGGMLPPASASGRTPTSAPGSHRTNVRRRHARASSSGDFDGETGAPSQENNGKVRARRTASESQNQNQNQSPLSVQPSNASGTANLQSSNSGNALPTNLTFNPLDLSYAPLSNTSQPQSQTQAGQTTDPLSQSASASASAADLNLNLNMNMSIDDPLFWGNFDYNISDIFGAASWENMTGGSGSAGGGNLGVGMGSGGAGGMFMGWGDLFGGGNGG